MARVWAGITVPRLLIVLQCSIMFSWARPMDRVSFVVFWRMVQLRNWTWMLIPGIPWRRDDGWNTTPRRDCFMVKEVVVVADAVGSAVEWGEVAGLC